MKTSLKKHFLPALLSTLSLIPLDQASAQPFTTLYSFSVLNPDPAIHGGSNRDGAEPGAGLLLSGNMLYGTAQIGGASGNGTIFKINTDGTGFEMLYNFTASLWNGPNADGAYPERGLILSNNTIYGTAYGGGASSDGTVFKLNADGTGFMTLYYFSALRNGTNADGAHPNGNVVLSGNRLYGTTRFGGTEGSGTVFAINTDGSGFTNLYNFSALDFFTNSNEDGANPVDIILLNNTLYGSASLGGSSGDGTIFSLTTDGNDFAVLHAFAGSDGVQPFPGLIASGSTLYGTTYEGGAVSPGGPGGTVFALNTDGSGFSTLYSFTANPFPDYTNSDGCCPQGELVLSGNTLYGTASHAGAFNNGTVFAINTDGSGFTNLHTFSAGSSPYQTNSDGSTPFGGLVLAGNTLYGTATSGGAWGSGTVFSLTLTSVAPPQLTISSFGSDVFLTWPTNPTGFSLQSTTNIASAGHWTPAFHAPVVINDQYVVTNPISGTQQFFRLSQ